MQTRQDATAIWLFREELGKKVFLDKLFNRFKRHLRKAKVTDVSVHKSRLKDWELNPGNADLVMTVHEYGAD